MAEASLTNHLRQPEGSDSLLNNVDIAVDKHVPREEACLKDFPAYPLSQQAAAAAMFRTSTREMEAWVLRTSDVRHGESKRRGGRITRPLNSYMAYRTVFAALLKVLLPDQYKDQKTVSKMAAISWAAEPCDVKDEYRRLAQMEKSKHMQAFPAYKLQRQKPGDKQSSRRPDSRPPHPQSGLSVDNGGATPSSPDWETAAPVCAPPGLTNAFQDALKYWPGIDEDVMPWSPGTEPLALYQGFFDFGGSSFESPWNLFQHSSGNYATPPTPEVGQFHTAGLIPEVNLC